MASEITARRMKCKGGAIRRHILDVDFGWLLPSENKVVEETYTPFSEDDNNSIKTWFQSAVKSLTNKEYSSEKVEIEKFPTQDTQSYQPPSKF